VAAELVVFALAKTTQTASPSQDCQPAADLGIPENTQAALAKIDIRCENQQRHFNSNLADGLAWIRAGRGGKHACR